MDQVHGKEGGFFSFTVSTFWSRAKKVNFPMRYQPPMTTVGKKKKKNTAGPSVMILSRLPALQSFFSQLDCSAFCVWDNRAAEIKETEGMLVEQDQMAGLPT